MKKLWIAAVAAGWARAAQAGMGIVWSTCGWCVEAGGDTRSGPWVAKNNTVTWQLVYAGANNVPDAIDPSADGWTGGDDVLLAERVVPAGGGSAADGTSWDSLLMQQGGNTTYEDPTWPADRGGFVFQRVFQGAPSEGTPYAESGLFAFDPAFAGNGAPPDLFYFPADGYGLVLDRAVTPPTPVPYLDPVNHTTNTCADYTLYTGQTTLDTGWYVVSGDITNDTRIAVSGDVNLILADGASLTANEGVNVDVDGATINSLMIWAQSDGPDMGRLTSQGGGMGAGIGGHGGGYVGSGGTITINGGVVTATGSTGSAGIGGGGGSFGGAGGTVTVNGGVVTATGGDGAAGIGGGLGVFVDEGGAGGTLTIIGGTVTAIAGKKDNFAQGTAPQAIGQGQQATNEGSLDFTGMKVYASEDATEPVAAGDRMAACRGGWAKLAPCAPHAVASCRWCGMESFLVRKLFDGEHHGTNTFATVELTVYSEAAKSPDAHGSCLTYVIEGGGIDCTDNVDENGQHAKLNGVYGIEQANHSMAVFNDAGWAYIKADLKENSTIRVTGTFGPYDPEYAAEAPNGMDKRKTLSTTGLLLGQTFYVIERDPGDFYAGPTGYVYTGDDAAADPRVDAGGMADTQALTMPIRDETIPVPGESSIPEGALFLKGVTTGAPTTVFVVNITDETKFTDMAARVKDYDEPYDGQGHGLGVTMSDSEVDDYDWTGRYALGDSTGPTNAWSGVKPVFTNVCDVTVWVEAVLEGWSGTTSGVVRIRPAALAITAKNQTCDFDDLPHGEDRSTYTDPAEIAAKVEVSGLVPGDGLASVTLDGTRTAPGTGPIIPSGVVVTNATGDVTFNYAVSYTNGTLTILGPPPEVTDVTAAPTGGSWQGQVDIFFNVTNDVARGLPDWNTPFLSIVATDNLTGSNYVSAASALSGDTDAADGPHSVTWDLRSQGIRLSSSSVTFRVAYVEWPKPYCVIDLSGGPSASRYPVSYVSEASEVPGGAPTADDCRRTNLVLRLVEPGSFLMGNGRSARQVTLTRPFYMGVFETTQTQWTKVMDYNTSDHFGFTFPMEYVSWNSIRGNSDTFNWPSVTGVGDDSFMGKLRARTGLEVDLPTEAQWEYACRAGTTGDYAGTGILDEMGFYLGNGGNRNCTATVGSYQPNGWGLYDMHGNVAEWCLDWAGTPPGGTDPVGPQSGTWRVKRGGSYEKSADDCTSHSRDSMYPHLGKGETGFRVCQTVQDAGAVICSGAGASIAVNPAFAVTVVGGSTTNSPATAGTTVTVAADEPDPGKAFVQWTGDDGVVFADASAAETTFAMPATNVTATAVFAEILIGGLDDGGYPWTGKAVEPDVAVSLDGVGLALQRGRDYAVSCSNNVNSGTATVTVAMLPPRLGSRTATFTILPRPEVTDVTAAPTGGSWKGQVDVAFNVTNSLAAACPDWNTPFLSIVATDNLTGSNYVSSASALSGDTDAADGPHSVTWDMDSQGIDLASSNVTFTVAYLKMPDYCVIDLSGGSNAKSFAVSGLDAEPEGGFNTGEYKTTKLAMRLLAPGTFTMGGTTETEITNAFYCALFETTQRQWELVAGNRPSYFTNETYYATRPVEKVSWNMIRGDAETYDWPNVKDVDPESFVGVLRRKSGLASLDLPAEEQWEYACRAGTTTDFNNGKNWVGKDKDTNLNEIARYWYNDGRDSSQSSATDHGTAAVGSYLPNAWGLYDMHGNVFEWCLDAFTSSASDRMGRGACFNSSASFCTSSYRAHRPPSYMNSTYGFRLVRTLSDNLEGEPGTRTVCAGASETVALVKDASVAFCGTFTLTGREMAAGEFAAGLYDAAGNSLQTVTNAADGSFAFEAIEYGLADAGKTFSYVVKQVAGTAGGVQYDTTEHTVEVVVSVGADRLVANVTDNFTDLAFANGYSAAATGEVKVRKNLQGRAWADGDSFEFTLAAVSNAPALPTSAVVVSKDSADHAASFGTVTFTQAGDYAYTVQETRGALPGMAYDGTTHTVAFHLADDGQGHLVASDGGGLVQTVEITNTYSTGDLTVSNRVTSSAAADKNLDFSFTVTLSDTAINGGFGDMTFTDGVAGFSLKDGETATAASLPTGIGFTVAQADAEGFTTSSENVEGTIATTAATAAFTNVRNDLALAVTAGKWGTVSVETNGVACAAVGPDATANLVVGYGSSVTAAAAPDSGFAVDGDADTVSFASYTASTNLVFAFRPEPTDAAVRWKFSSAVGRYFAQVAIPAHAGYAEALDGLAFLFADRTNRVGDVYAQLWNAAARAPEDVLVTDNGVAYRGVALDTAAFDSLAEGTNALWGVSDETLADARNVVPAGERPIGLYVRKRVSPVSGNETAAEVENFLGYLTWTVDGARWFLPVVEGAANGAATTAVRRAAAAAPAPAPGRFAVSRRTYAPATLGLAATLGLGAETVAAEPPTARIAEFEVGADGSVAGRVEAAAGGEASSSFGGTATVRILSSGSLAGPWREEASAEADPATGAFALPPGGVDPDARFFKAVIETREIYE